MAVVGGKGPRKSLLGKLAVGLLIACVYVAGTNLWLFSSVAQQEHPEEPRENRNPDRAAIVPANGKKEKSKKFETIFRKKENIDEYRAISRQKAAAHHPSNLFRDGNNKPNDPIRKAVAISESSKNKPPSSVGVTKQAVPRDDAIYTCTYGATQENRTTVIAPKHAPSFVIIGVQKSGSTALLTHCRDHPQMLQTKLKFRREAHFFDASWQGILKKAKTLGLTQANDKHCLALEHYMKLFETETILANSQTMAHESANDSSSQEAHHNATHHLPLFTFEKTPTYFVNPKIPARMKQTIPWSKIILVLRNPVDRLYSQYKMTVQTSFELRQYSLEDMIYHELKAMKEYNMTTAPLMVPVNITQENTTDSSVPVKAERYNMPAEVPNDHAVTDPNLWQPKHRAILKKPDYGILGHHILVRRGLYSTQLRWWLQRYTVGQDLLVINYRDLANDTRAVYERVLGFAGIPLPYDPAHQDPQDVGINFDQRVRADKNKHDRPLAPSTRRYLEAFYAPYTDELESLLGPEWSSDKLGWYD